jgi:predicted Zn-dependent protease
MTRWIGLLAILAVSAPAYAQIGGLIRRAEQATQKLDELVITETEEVALGADVSARIRERFGVVQDPAVHQYVALVGAVLTEQTTRPALPWTFIVLDTDGVNAFASPGGYVHITRGALGLIDSEAELAGVLAHEIAHVTRKHTVNAVQKSKSVQLGASQARSDRRQLLGELTNQAYEMVLENAFDRGDELDADREGILLVAKTGYAAGGLGQFLGRLAQRNKDQPTRNGLFASHPETQERIKRALQVAGSKPGATVAARYNSTITYEPVDVASIAVVEEGAAGLAGSGNAPAAAKEQPRRRGFGLGNLTRTVTPDKPSQQVAASGGARGVGSDRLATGGGTPTLVKVSVTSAALAEFKKGIA